VQAFIRLDGDSGRVTGGPRLPYALKFTALVYFREAQQCRIPEQWPLFEARFFQKLERLCIYGDVEEDDHDEFEGDNEESDSENSSVSEKAVSTRGPSEAIRKARWVFFRDYIKKNYFSPFWLR